MDRIKNAWLVLQTALSIIPQVMEIIRAIETPGNGAEKAATVTNLIVEAFQLLPDELRGIIGATKIDTFARKVIEIIVTYFNKVKIFGSSPTTQTVKV